MSETERRDPKNAERRTMLPRRGGRRETDPPADWVTISAFARRYGIDRHTVYKWLDARILQTYAVGKLLRIRNLPPDQHRPSSMCAPACMGENAPTQNDPSASS